MTDSDITANVDEVFTNFLEHNKYKSWMTGEALQAFKRLQSDVSHIVKQVKQD